MISRRALLLRSLAGLALAAPFSALKVCPACKTINPGAVANCIVCGTPFGKKLGDAGPGRAPAEGARRRS